MSTRQTSFVQHDSPVFWVGVALTLYGMVYVVPLIVSSFSVYPLAGLMAALAWSLYGAVLLVILYRLELFQRRSKKTIVGAFVWGAVVVTGIGATASPAMSELVNALLGDDLADWTTAIAASLVEEPLKMLGVVALAMIPGSHIRTTLDGLFYGLIVGLGFEIVESFLYTTKVMEVQGGSLEVIVAMIILRGVIGGLWSHPTFSGISGAGVGYFFSSPRSLPWRLFVSLGSLVVAMFFHALFNSPILAGLGIAGAVLKGVLVLAVLIVVLVLADNHERLRFGSVAASSVDTRLISDQERTILSHRATRRGVVRQTRRARGREAGEAVQALQIAQIDVVDAAMDDGVDSDRFRLAASNVEAARERLA